MSSELIGVPQHPVAAFAERLNTRVSEEQRAQAEAHLVLKRSVMLRWSWLR